MSRPRQLQAPNRRYRPERTPPVRPPVASSASLHDTRRLAIWVGLVGGAAILVASILRPLVARTAVIAPLAQRQLAMKSEEAGKVAATKVDFFTMVRGE